MTGALTEIPADEVRFHPVSLFDPNAKLFWWRNGLYRGIHNQRWSQTYKSLFDTGVVQTLIDKNLLVPTEVTGLALGGYGAVLSHERVPFVSYPYEWCADMLKDAALLIVDLNIELARHDLTLQDGHPWNVLFRGSRPVFVDFGSIMPVDDTSLWPAYDEFCRLLLNPLQLIARGHERIVRALLHCEQGVLKSELLTIGAGASLTSELRKLAGNTLSKLKQQVPSSLRPMLRKGAAALRGPLKEPALPTSRSRLDFFQGVRREVEAISLPRGKTEWTDYYADAFPQFVPSSGWTAKNQSVYEVLCRLKPESVLDIGSNAGWYAQLAATLGSRVVAFDTDETCSAGLYRDLRTNSLSVLPLVMCVVNPSPATGIGGCMPSATQRFSCDMVFALALVHHLVFKRNLKFDRIVEGLSGFTSKWLIVEFIPREDKYVSEWWTTEHEWYTLENFQDSLKRYYSKITVLPSNPKPRLLLLCEK